MIRNIIFDWSGTLVDDMRAVWRSTNYTFTQCGRPEMSLEEFRAEFSLPFDAFYERATPGVPLEQLEDWYKESFREEQKEVTALPHAAEFLDFCQANSLRTFLLSTIHPDHYRVQSAAVGFAFEREYIRIMDKRKKISEILGQNRLNPAETVFIGDMQHDIETAHAGGVHSCAVLTGYNTADQLAKAQPELTVAHLGEFQALLSQHNLNWPVALRA